MPVRGASGSRARGRFATVVFDCDSTLSAIEGIDVLGAAHGPTIARMTEAAMRGETPLEDVYGRRLTLVRPSRAAVDALAREYVAHLVPDARAVVEALRREFTEVHIISGGLWPAVRAVGDALGIAAACVHAVRIEFDAQGAYAGFDEKSPLARSRGKHTLLTTLARDLARPVLMVGDGATDLEARPPADAFVAYAGVIARDAVIAEADWVVRSASLAPILPIALGFTPPSHAEFRALYDKGIELLDAGITSTSPGSP